MVTVRTLLRSSDGTFAPMNRSATPPPDLDYVEGAIELSVDSVEIVGRAQWDYVDQLWAYIATMIETLRTKDEASTYFPDQPIRLTFSRKGRRILVSCESGEVKRVASADESELLARLRVAGREFFDAMGAMAPANNRSYQISLAQLSD